MISTIALILVLLAAVAGIVWSVIREAHHDCNNGCGKCELACTCKKAVMVLTAMLVVITSSGINIEHHCHHCRQAEAAAHCHDHGTCAHCDHCAHCFFVHLDLDQYDLTQHIAIPTPEAISLLCPMAQPEPMLQLSNAQSTHRLLTHAPPCTGQEILHIVHKLVI